MKYHETVPTQPGFYYDIWRHKVELHATSGDGDSPLLGPLPSTRDEAIALACEVAFARYAMAEHNRDADRIHMKLLNAMLSIRERFLTGERSLSLYRDMERVTRELTGEKT